MINTETVVSLFIEYKNDGDGFDKFLEDRVKENEAKSKERA